MLQANVKTNRSCSEAAVQGILRPPSPSKCMRKGFRYVVLYVLKKIHIADAANTLL